ncbi:MAG: hypothetical protein U0T56_01545 [Ferruginibacter sp.]
MASFLHLHEVVPANAQIVDGQGTTSILFCSSGYITGNILVKTNPIAVPVHQQFNTVSGFVPNAPGEITELTNSCIYINSPLVATYSIRKVANASSYIWTVPGITIIDHPAGLGVNDTIINVSFNGSFVSGSQIAVQSMVRHQFSSQNHNHHQFRNATGSGCHDQPCQFCPVLGYDTTVTYKVPRVFNATIHLDGQCWYQCHFTSQRAASTIRSLRLTSIAVL